MSLIDQSAVEKKLSGRMSKNKIFKALFFACTLIGLIILAILIIDILRKGLPVMSADFFTNFSSSSASTAGVKGALIGTLWLMMTLIPIALVLGVGSAIYLEEYAKDNAFTKFVKINISNLASVPSIVYGLLGATIFVSLLKLGNSVIAAALTLALLILPVIIVASQEAIRAVPNSVKEASYGLGANKWQTIKNVVLPAAIPGIVTGVILAISRAIGETAPLVAIGIPTILLRTPNSILDSFQTLPLQIYDWARKPGLDFQALSSAAIIVLLIILLILNTIAVIIRNKFSKKY
ncbi:phosphate ABC transporter permease PstA [Staphylococcus chromogenes]|uniref:phosphate ABC transporter permease PstA n=1 Tax=Staphylococcus chromogenes TaxID=46126 RepID=UPI000D19EA72|nr:phosphate ABC transporter permease PstA [Staphylococcus chromogenes]MDT0654535.1 phosphate ABC transporter permease PstA [Staphylococcus chromogenes]MDT0670918.1 phosphate ABC transporter permease PstA [Staphylococcus chromogenes]MDT0673110.1 phosphate ABC transporter permease PstA [Staphylococcus chromogenes]PTG24031.1 phosphate ABC transporter permease PtsA [Staphylococcus chromogenes]PTG97093.1 phosphate ABC transporter permease PtsA [Staphylococcus chromogenes]